MPISARPTPPAPAPAPAAGGYGHHQHQLQYQHAHPHPHHPHRGQSASAQGSAAAAASASSSGHEHVHHQQQQQHLLHQQLLPQQPPARSLHELPRVPGGGGGSAGGAGQHLVEAHALAQQQQQAVDMQPPPPQPHRDSSRSGSGGGRPFAVLAAAEIFGEKVNLELPFEGRPTLQDLHALAMNVFSMERAVQRRDAAPMGPMVVAKTQLYDPAVGAWRDLTADAQLSDGCQVYLLQEDSLWHKESDLPIPEPQRPMRACLPPETQFLGKARALFEEADVNGDGVVDAAEFARMLRTLRVALRDEQLQQLLAPFAGSGLAVAPFTALCSDFPTLCECLYLRTREFWRSFRLKHVWLGEEAVAAAIDEMCKTHETHIARAKELRTRHQRSLTDWEAEEAAHERRRIATTHEADAMRAALAEGDAAVSRAAAHLESSRHRRASAHNQLEGCGRQVQKTENAIDAEAQGLAAARAEEARLLEALEACRQTMAAHSGRVEGLSSEKSAMEAGMKRAIDAVEAVEREVLDGEEELAAAESRRVGLKEDLKALQRKVEEEMRAAAALRSSRADILASIEEVDAVLAEQQQLHARAEADARSHRDAVRTLAHEHDEALARRRECEAAEQPLLEQELELKHRRHALAQQESQLRHDASGVFAASSRVQQRGDTSMLGYTSYARSRSGATTGAAASPARTQRGGSGS